MKPILTLISVYSVFVGIGNSATLTFDDLSPGPGFLSVPSGYGGLVWSNFLVVDAFSEPANSGYRTGMVSPTNIVFDTFARPASITSGGLFDLSSAYLTAAWDNGLNLQVQGFSGPVLKYDNTYALGTAGPLFVNFDYLGIDRVIFIPSLDLGSSQFVMDNLTIVVVPEPGTLGLLLAGTGLVGFRMLRGRFLEPQTDKDLQKLKRKFSPEKP